MEGTEISRLHTCRVSIMIHALQQSSTFLTNEACALCILIIQSPQCNLGFTLEIVCVMGLDKYMTCIQHDSVMCSSFSVLKSLCALLIHPFPPLSPGNHIFTVAISCLFQNVIYFKLKMVQPFQMDYFRLVIGICFLHIFSQLNSSFLFSAE